MVFPKNRNESESRKHSFTSELNFPKSLYQYKQPSSLITSRGMFAIFTALCSPLSLLTRQTFSIIVWDASMLSLICLGAFSVCFCCFLCLFILFGIWKTKKKSKSWLAEVFYRKRVMQGLFHLMLIVCCTFAKTYAVSVVLLWFAKSDN